MLATDSALAARAKRDDRAAYEELTRRHFDALYRLAYAIIGNHVQTEDAVQECFVQAYMALPRFDESQAFAPWIKGIAVNCARSAVRSRNRAGQPMRREVSLAPDENPEQLVASRDVQAAVRNAVMRLPQQQRTAIKLFALEEKILERNAEYYVKRREVIENYYGARGDGEALAEVRHQVEELTRQIAQSATSIAAADSMTAKADLMTQKDRLDERLFQLQQRMQTEQMENFKAKREELRKLEALRSLNSEAELIAAAQWQLA